MLNQSLNPLFSSGLSVENRGFALELQRIVKHFGGVQAVRGVTVNVAHREVLALLGENGAGKSTLVGVAAGRLVPDSGQVLVDGVDITGLGPARASHAGVRLVPQELMLCKDMSVVDNVLLGQQPRVGRLFLNRDAARRETRRRLAVLGVTDLDLDASVGTLSVVDQAFVQIARAFTVGTKVLLIDEPTSPMDDKEVDRFLAVLTKLKESGTSIIYISHRLDEVFRLADRAAILRDGSLVAELSGAEMTRKAVVSAMVGGRTLRDVRPEAMLEYGEVALTCEGISGRGVHRVDFTVRKGEIACIYGISGSGREEIGGLIAGAVKLKSGRVVIGNAVVRRGSVADSVAHGMGYVPAERRTQGLILESTVASNMTLAVLKRLARFGFLASSAPVAVAREWVDRLQIRTRSVKTPVGSLSGGSQQKVLLSRWLVADSEVLVLEEPTRGVDVGTKAEIYHLLGELARQGKAVLVVTSDIEEATLVSERVLVMRSGRIAGELTSPTQEELALAAHGLTEVVGV
jgi:ABC-type sugar transport system ATPase subunit